MVLKILMLMINILAKIQLRVIKTQTPLSLNK